jgi:hypothetical protein
MRPHLIRFGTVLISALLPALSLAACEQKVLTGDAPQGVSTITNCNAQIEKAWLIDPQHIYKADASTIGPSCSKAIVVLAVRASDGTPLIAWSSKVEDVFGLHDVEDVNTMKPALEAWIDQAETPFKTTAEMPEWAAGRDAPGAAGEEFPFHPESGIDREGWENLRKEKAPVFAFAQGRESQAIYALHNDQLELIGVQQFPG